MAWPIDLQRHRELVGAPRAGQHQPTQVLTVNAPDLLGGHAGLEPRQGERGQRPENLRRARFKAGAIPQSDVLRRALPGIQARIAGIWGGCDAFTGRRLDEVRRTLASPGAPSICA